jgi:prepilin-type N-terminal cleavage/methylation domain-containing protein
MSPISAHSRHRPRGFTLVELAVALSLGTIIIAGSITAYLFLGRNLTRLVNIQQQEVKGRRTLKMFTEDVSSAISLTTCTDSQIVLTKPTAGANSTVTYTYTSGAGSTGTFSRTESGNTQTLLTNLTSFDFSYYSESNSSVSNSTPQSVKSIEFTYTSAVGTAASGTLASYTTISPRVVMRNKPLLTN